MRRFVFGLLLLSATSCTLHHTSTNDVSDLRVEISDCPTHNEVLIESTQKVDGSRVSHDPLYWRIRDALFPCAFPPSEDGDLALIKYCRSCRIAKALCENSKDYDLLYSAWPTDETSQSQHNRKNQMFIERKTKQLNQIRSESDG
jgi:hypothetical protein